MQQRDYSIIDVHQHVGPWPFAGKWGGIELNQQYLEQRGIKSAIISSTEAIVDDMVAGNNHLAEDLVGHPNLYGYVVVNPRFPELSARQLETHYANPKFVGAKIHTSYSDTPMGNPRMAAIFAVLAKYRKPLLIHTWGVAAVQALAGLAGRFPDLPIIVAHAGGTAWREAIAAAEHQQNLYLDFCFSNPEPTRIERAVATVGPQQVVFGTDATLFDPLYLLSCFDSATITEEDRAKVMGGNALDLFELSGKSTKKNR